MATASEIIRARRRAVGGRRDRCRRGKPCSAACVARWKECLAEMPAPVQGSLPRAVKAIQERRGRINPKQRRQVQQVRREQVKGKLEEQRRSFIKSRNSLRIKIQRAIFLEEYTNEDVLRGKLKRLEDEVGSRLRVPKSPPIENKEVLERLRRSRDSFRTNLMNLSGKLNKAAGQNSERPNRKLYNELEKKLVGLSNKINSPLWKGGDMRSYRVQFANFQPGKVWNQKAEERKLIRQSKLKSVYADLKKEALQAASNGDRKKYQDAERKILKISERAGSRLGGIEKPTKGSLWKEARVPKALRNLMDSMEDALAFGNLAGYNKLEAKFIKARDGYVRGDNRKADKLWLEIGPKYGYRKGQLLEEQVDKLKRDMALQARSKNRGEYDRTEKRLLRLKPEEKKGAIWKEEVARRVNDYLPVLRNKMEMAISNGNRKEYNKLERTLIRLDPMEKKGRMWKEAKLRDYLPTLEAKVREAAANGNRKEYDKLERILMRAEPGGFYSRKGALWKRERVHVATSKLREEMEKAVRDDDRARYNRLEAKFIKMKDRVGSALIRDYDMRYLSKGEFWEKEKGRARITDLESSINVGKREGVGKISISGDVLGFKVSSDILGNSLDLEISPGESTSFKVNGSYTATENLSRREKVAITREVTRQYTEVMKNMDEGTVFKVSAAEGDGREDMRVKAYTGFGFSDPDYNGYMYGVVRNGKMEPIDEDEYYDLRS